MQERVGGAAAPAVALGELEAPDPLLARAVEVWILLVAGHPRRLEHRVDERMHRAALGDRHRPADAVKLVLATLVVLGAPEVRQDLVVAPAVAPGRRPAVVVGTVAADVDHRVDRATASHRSPPGEIQAAVVQTGLRLT